MKIALSAGVAALSLVAASPAMAATFINVTDQGYVIFNGSELGTSATLLLTLTGESSLTNTFTFSYTFQNTSNTATNPSVRIPGFGFNDSTNQSGTGTATGVFDTVTFNENFPTGLGNREVCVTTSNCLGGSDGVTVGMGPVSGSFTLDYAGTGLTQITLDNFAVRYISTGLNGAGSGTGTGSEVQMPVPEPSTWAMMLIGFGAVGFGLRRRKGQGNPARVRIAYS